MGEKKVKQIREQTGLDIVKIQVRGNTGHRKDLCLRDGTVTYLWPDGTLEPATWRGEPIRWS